MNMPNDLIDLFIQFLESRHGIQVKRRPPTSTEHFRFMLGGTFFQVARETDTTCLVVSSDNKIKDDLMGAFKHWMKAVMNGPVHTTTEDTTKPPE